MAEKTNILINALPKSASLYIVRALAATLGLEQTRIGTRGMNRTQVDVLAAHEFLAGDRTIAQDHIAATSYNLDLLYYVGLRKLVVMFRDPRDAMVSWAHQLERDDVVGNRWHWALMVSSGIISEDYYDLSSRRKLDVLIERHYPLAQEWMRGWLAAESGGRLEVGIRTYEQFVEDPEVFVRGLLAFFDVDPRREILWPKDTGRRISTTIRGDTHFRRGVVGSHRDELSPQQVARLNAGADAEMFERFNWPVP